MSRLKDKLARLHRKNDAATPNSEAKVEAKVESESRNTHPTPESALITKHNGHEDKIDIQMEFADPHIDEFKRNNIGLYTNEFGSFLLKRTTYNKSHVHGMYALAQLEHVEAHLHRFFNVDELDRAERVLIDKLLFFDLETTGLGTGTGNIPFMVGLGYYQDDNYIVEQAVIRHAAEERALLAYLHRLTARFEYLVTYNGKTFDWPLMVNRYVLNGMREEIWQPKHIDLLHPSRFIWRNALQSCKLSYIEEARLGITRIDDLPGAEAPDRYFKYLSDGDPEHLFPVYRHNQLDMLSLVSLLIRFGYLLSDQDVKSIIQLPIEPEEMIRTGLWLEKMGLTSQCEELFELAIQLPVSYAQTLYKLSIRDKQHGNEQRASYLWRKIIESDTINIQAKIDCCVQLAIYDEHKAKQFEQALQYTKKALSLATRLLYEERENKKRETVIKNTIMALEKRELRLSKKINR